MSPNREARPPLLCRLGFHQWYSDGAFFTHADRCDRCSKWRDERQAAYLLREREAWAEAEGTHDEQIAFVAKRVAGL